MHGGRTVWVGIVSVLASLLVVPGPATAGSVPGTTCPVFPRSNVWHMNVSALPLNAKSATWKHATHAGSTFLHPDFGPPSYGIPFTTVGGSHSKVAIDFTYASESDRQQSLEAGCELHLVKPADPRFIESLLG